MVAYSFRPRFVAPILAGIKTGTIRAEGLRRHAMAGEQLQLYTGMRTKQCKLILRTPCIAAPRIALYFKNRTRIETCGQVLRGAKPLDSFARADGFRDFGEMRDFWRDEHDATTFGGVWVRWMGANPLHAPHAMGSTYVPTYGDHSVPGAQAA